MLIEHHCVAGLSGYSTDMDEGRAVSGLSPLPFVSPSLGVGPQMHPRLSHPSSSLTSSPGYTAQMYSVPAVYGAVPQQQQQQLNQRQHYPSAGSDLGGLANVRPSRAFQGNSPNSNPGVQHTQEAAADHAQHAEHALGGRVASEAQAGPQGASRHASAATDAANSSMAAEPAQKETLARADAAADAVPALQSNLTAMDSAIRNTSAAALPVQPTAAQSGVAAADSSSQEQAAGSMLPPVKAAVAQPFAPRHGHLHDSTRPASTATAHQEVVSLPAGSSSSDAPGQMLLPQPPVLAPIVSHQASSLPPAILAPIGPPAMRSMTSQGQGALPQLTAPALLPLPPIPEINSRDCETETRQHSLGITKPSQQDEQAAVHQITVSAASAEMLNEARAAGTARQAALAVLNDPVQSAHGPRPADTHQGLPDQPFGSAQSSLSPAVDSTHQFSQKASLPPTTAAALPMAARPQGLTTVASMGRPQSLMAMTGPLPAAGQGQEADSPVGVRPSQSETAVTAGRGIVTVTEPQDLHAAHLVHVLQAHKASQHLTESAGQTSELLTSQQQGTAQLGRTALTIPPEDSSLKGEC